MSIMQPVLSDYTTVGGHQLDAEQLACIQHDAHNHLVIAGAGTGKTTTIVGRVKYLLATGKARPEEICALVYNRENANEMRRKIQAEAGSGIDVFTFHGLGYRIIGKTLSIPPWVKSERKKKQFVGQVILEKQQNDRKYKETLRRYLSYCPDKTEFDFISKEEFLLYKNDHPMLTMMGENVKSYGELEIANYLTRHGIKYEYERAYEVDTSDETHAQYHPDFYLPEYGIYIEYFGINHQGEVPVWFSGRDGKTATETYQQSMEWKRATHRANGTILIECYGYEKIDDVLSERLEERLQEHGVEVDCQVQAKQILALWQQIQKDPDSRFGKLCDLLINLIDILKTKEMTVAEAKMENLTDKNSSENADILELLEPVFAAYAQRLAAEDGIDFVDMIIQSRKKVEQGQYCHQYKYVIIDEYQDLSDDRYKLIKALREVKDFDLFCVGDDWQGINGYAGARIDYILNFAKYWGPTDTSYIQTTYRFGQSLAEASGKFIMQNPHQLTKSIKSATSEAEFALEEVCSDQEDGAAYNLCGRLETLPEQSTVFLLGRYNSDLEMIRQQKLFEVKRGDDKISYLPRPDLEITFHTVHGSKGLEADYVFLLNNKNTVKGFPSRITDLPIIRLLNNTEEEYPFAEERRVYYVALTRARVKTCILTLGDKLSEFVNDLHENFANKMLSWQTCPKCKTGKLCFHCGSYGAFYGCSEYHAADGSSCRYTYNLRSMK